MRTRNNPNQTDQLIALALARLDTDVVLCDVGASGAIPDIWKRIANQASYIGFDPDQRAMGHFKSSIFKRQTIINKAVTNSDSSETVKFYLTRSPFCSSTLRPLFSVLANYAYVGLFEIVGEEVVPATTLEAVFKASGLTAPDWLKLDSQGTDLRLLDSLRDETCAQVLAVDLEPGLQQNYVDEDTFAMVHASMIARGFWLSNLDVRGAIRMRPNTISYLQQSRPEVSVAQIQASIRDSPMWVEARYLRTFESVPDNAHHRRNLIVLWSFSLLDNQPGYALDIAAEYERRYGQDQILPLLKAIPFPRALTLASRFKALLPKRLKQWVKRQVQ